jgi:flagellar biosynthetic protein FliQ
MGGEILYAAQQAILLTVLVSAPPILAALAVGLLVALAQALTQIQEQTIQMVGKLVAIFAVLLVFGYWMASQLLRFTVNIFERFPEWIG